MDRLAQGLLAHRELRTPPARPAENHWRMQGLVGFSDSYNRLWDATRTARSRLACGVVW